MSKQQKVKLSKAELEQRRGVAGWCQSCLIRHVPEGRKACKWCTK